MTGALEELLETASGAARLRQIVQATLQLIEQAGAEGRLAEAVRLADVALPAARNSNHANLMRQAAFIKRRLDAMQKK